MYRIIVVSRISKREKQAGVVGAKMEMQAELIRYGQDSL